MANKSMTWYINNNDFEGAKERLESTSASWKARWFNVCQTIFNNCKELVKKYILDPINYLIETIEEREKISKDTKYAGKVLYQLDDLSVMDRATNKCYLVRFYTHTKDNLCGKVGTTIRSIYTRLNEELMSDTYAEAQGYDILRIYDCGTIPPEGLESQFRAHYIRNNPKAFNKNDRFMGIEFDLEEADRIYADYVGLVI